MVIKIGGFRKKTRHKLKKAPRQKSKISLRKYFQEFSKGDVVTLKAEPAVQGGMYFPRFHGRKGTVVGQRGSNYIISFKDHDKVKTLIVHPVHLEKIMVSPKHEQA
jgi:large subunit ribosomal protein L21e